MSLLAFVCNQSCYILFVGVYLENPFATVFLFLSSRHIINLCGTQSIKYEFTEEILAANYLLTTPLNRQQSYKCQEKRWLKR